MDSFTTLFFDQRILGEYTDCILKVIIGINLVGALIASISLGTGQLDYVVSTNNTCNKSVKTIFKFPFFNQKKKEVFTPKQRNFLHLF